MCELIRLAVLVTNEPDPLRALEAAAAMRAELEEQIVVLTGRVVVNGRGWPKVAWALGMTRQGAHRRYAALVAPLDDDGHSGGSVTGPQVR